jgi:hypothetical protein
MQTGQYDGGGIEIWTVLTKLLFDNKRVIKRING